MNTKNAIGIKWPRVARYFLPAYIAEDGIYFVIGRKWKNGDIITFILPMDFRITKFTGLEKGFEENHYAMDYGPILMAMVGVKAKKSDIGVIAGPENIKELLRPVQEEPFSCFPEFFNPSK